MRRMGQMGVMGMMLLALCGCTVVSNDRVFPKLTWAWTADAKRQRESDAAAKQYQKSSKDWQGELQKAIEK